MSYLAMHELREKNQTLNKIKADVQAMTSQLKAEKDQLKAKKEEEERIKVQKPAKKGSLQKKDTRFSMLSSIRNNKEMM